MKNTNILAADISIDDTITDADRKVIAMLHELGPIEQKYYIAELNRAATEARRCRNNDIENAHRKEMQS